MLLDSGEVQSAARVQELLSDEVKIAASVQHELSRRREDADRRPSNSFEEADPLEDEFSSLALIAPSDYSAEAPDVPWNLPGAQVSPEHSRIDAIVDQSSVLDDSSKYYRDLDPGDDGQERHLVVLQLYQDHPSECSGVSVSRESDMRRVSLNEQAQSSKPPLGQTTHSNLHSMLSPQDTSTNAASPQAAEPGLAPAASPSPTAIFPLPTFLPGDKPHDPSKVFALEAMSVVDPRRLWNVPYHEIELMLRARASGTGRTYGIAEPMSKPFPRFHLHILLIASTMGGRLGRAHQIILRTFLLLYWTVWSVLSLVQFGEDWPVYMGHWSVVVLELQFVLMLVFAIVWKPPPAKHAIALWHKSTCQCPHCQFLYFNDAHWRGKLVFWLSKCCWRLRNISTASALIVFVNWCSAIVIADQDSYSARDPRGAHPIAVHTHVALVLLVLLELAISDMPMVMSDGWYAAVYCVMYGLFTLPLHTNTGSIELHGQCCTYPLYDWSHAHWLRSVLLMVCMAVIIVPLIQIVLVKWHQWWRKHYPHISKPKRNTIRAAVRLRPTAEASTNGEQSRAAWESREIDVTANALWPSAPPRPDETMRRLGREPDDT